MEDLKLFKCQDFYQSVILKTLGYPLIRLEKAGERFVVFLFEVSEKEADEVLGEYWNRNLMVNARDLVENINELKSRIHEKLKEF